jgi:hypothetical protein
MNASCTRCSLPIEYQLSTNHFIVSFWAFDRLSPSTLAMAKKLSKKASAKKSANCTYNESSLEPYEELFTELQPPTGLKYEQEATGGVSTAPEESSQQPWTS